MFGSKARKLKKAMPVLARHEGEWTGTFIHLDDRGRTLDQHDATIQCLFPQKGRFPYLQISHYVWADGKTQELRLPARFKNGQLVWQQQHIKGAAWEIDAKTLLMKWSHTADHTNHMYEIIHLHKDDSERTRTLTWFRDDELYRRTLVTETRNA